MRVNTDSCGPGYCNRDGIGQRQWPDHCHSERAAGRERHCIRQLQHEHRSRRELRDGSNRQFRERKRAGARLRLSRTRLNPDRGYAGAPVIRDSAMELGWMAGNPLDLDLDCTRSALPPQL
jgi:hypothetical protein